MQINGNWLFETIITFTQIDSKKENSFSNSQWSLLICSRTYFTLRNISQNTVSKLHDAFAWRFLSRKTLSCAEALKRCSIIKGVLRNFAKFPRKHLCQSLFFNKVAGLRPEKTFFTEHLWTTKGLKSTVVELKNSIVYKSILYSVLHESLPLMCSSNWLLKILYSVLNKSLPLMHPSDWYYHSFLWLRKQSEPGNKSVIL